MKDYHPDIMPEHIKILEDLDLDPKYEQGLIQCMILFNIITATTNIPPRNEYLKLLVADMKQVFDDSYDYQTVYKIDQIIRNFIRKYSYVSVL